MNWGDWPGKSPVEEGGPEHPAAYHMLDVAAVAEVLIRPFGFSPALRDALVLLVALHDLGKISESFRAMLRGGVRQGWKHWELTEVLLFLHDEKLARHLGNTTEVRRPLYAAVAGHHGRPPQQAIGPIPLNVFDFVVKRALRQTGTGQVDAGALIDEFFALWPHASLEELEPESPHVMTLSWWLPGLCAAADWVGSNVQWFAPEAAKLSLADYLESARERAVVAVRDAGIAGASGRTAPLFDFGLRPMQEACRDVLLPSEGPVLAIIEDETGAGKTEAALILAQRMISAGKGRGLYFALPTMATADAMFARAADIVGRLFEGPTLTLAHGKAGLSDRFREVRLAAKGDMRGGDEASCTEWLAESRRRALLADVGIGTIDQALMSVLPVKHQTLRHFGLSSKILIVDEVHEVGEPYMAEELVALLKMHRAIGGSAILLTATLPLDLRRKLLATYDGEADDMAYPALTVAGAAPVTRFRADERPVKGVVRINRLDTPEDAVRLIVESAQKGAACVWVRNAVDDAIEAVAALRAQGIDARLLHARYALGDRKRIEAEMLARVGRAGSGRKGFVLVGTQVLESSLDLDLDVMVSDIAPVAALIQRAGRLWRHMAERPAASRPVPEPVLHILSPDPGKVDDERWLHGTLDRGAWVYPVAEIWRSARVLFSEGKIDAPSHLRGLIEAVYGADAEVVPDALLKAELEMEGDRQSAKVIAWHNIVNLNAGYRMAGGGVEDTNYPTRLGGEQRTLVLARRSVTGLQPWIDTDGSDGWALSEVTASVKRLAPLHLPDQSAADIIAIKRNWPKWKSETCHLCPVNDDGLICEGLRYDADSGLVFI